MFLSSNPKRVTIAKLASEAKVSQVSIYNFFGSKENLMREIFFAYMNEALDNMQNIMDSDRSFREKADEIFDMNMASAREISPDAYSFMQWDDPVIKEFQMEYATKKSLPLLLRFVDQGKNEGQIDPDLDNQTILLYLNTFGQISAPGVAERWGHRQREQLCQLFYYGLFGKATP